MPRERASDFEVLCRLTEPAEATVVDVGCGGGTLVRQLAAVGARAVGVEISAEQLAPARRADPEGRARYAIGRAEALPFEDSSIDLVVFMRALHHVPIAAMDAALAEARRVLRPDGAVYVAEPLPEGDYFTLTSLVEDEVEVRRAAQAALSRSRQAGLERAVTVEYEVVNELRSLEELRRRIVSVDPRRAEVFDARREELAQTLERLGPMLTAPMRADVLRPAA